MSDYLTSIHRERMPIHPQIPFKPSGVALTAFSQMLYMDTAMSNPEGLQRGVRTLPCDIRNQPQREPLETRTPLKL